MKNTKRYSQPTKAERRKVALDDAMDWLEPSQFRALKGYAKHIQWSRLTTKERCTCVGFLRMSISLTGIEGLPNTSLARHLIQRYASQ